VNSSNSKFHFKNFGIVTMTMSLGREKLIVMHGRDTWWTYIPLPKHSQFLGPVSG